MEYHNTEQQMQIYELENRVDELRDENEKLKKELKRCQHVFGSLNMKDEVAEIERVLNE